MRDTCKRIVRGYPGRRVGGWPSLSHCVQEGEVPCPCLSRFWRDRAGMFIPDASPGSLHQADLSLPIVHGTPISTTPSTLERGAHRSRPGAPGPGPSIRIFPASIAIPSYPRQFLGGVSVHMVLGVWNIRWASSVVWPFGVIASAGILC